MTTRENGTGRGAGDGARSGSGDAANDPLLRRLSDAVGPEASGPTTYAAVVSRVERRAGRRRTALSAAGGIAAVALVAGGGFVLGRSGGASTTAGSAAGASSPAGPQPVAGSGLAGSGAVQDESGASRDASGAAQPAGGPAGRAACPDVLPATVPVAMSPAADLAGQLVAAQPDARAVICAYPLPGGGADTDYSAGSPGAGGATPAPLSPGGTLIGTREVLAEASWLTRVAGLPATSDSAASGRATCDSAVPAAQRAVYLIQVQYAGGGRSWLRVVVGACGSAADNGIVTTRQAEGLVSEVRTAYEQGTPLR
ncbi:MAG: hypothetical protein M9891_11110 [Austwickia sp.]|nr:hypothetical protein [Austwickia sp.]